MVHTIDMNNVKEVLNNCKYYDEIINYDIAYDDIISFDLIDFYKDYIFSIKDINKMKEIDNIMYKYIDDYYYRKGIKKIISPRDIDINNFKKTNRLIRKLIKYDDNYEKERVLNIRVSRWI